MTRFKTTLNVLSLRKRSLILGQEFKMPIPQPRTDEDRNEFVSRCMREISNEYDQKQALAICYNTYKTKKAVGKIEKAFENIGKFLGKFRK